MRFWKKNKTDFNPENVEVEKETYSSLFEALNSARLKEAGEVRVTLSFEGVKDKELAVYMSGGRVRLALETEEKEVLPGLVIGDRSIQKRMQTASGRADIEDMIEFLSISSLKKYHDAVVTDMDLEIMPFGGLDYTLHSPLSVPVKNLKSYMESYLDKESDKDTIPSGFLASDRLSIVDPDSLRSYPLLATFILQMASSGHEAGQIVENFGSVFGRQKTSERIGDLILSGALNPVRNGEIVVSEDDELPDFESFDSGESESANNQENSTGFDGQVFDEDQLFAISEEKAPVLDLRFFLTESQASREKREVGDFYAFSHLVEEYTDSIEDLKEKYSNQIYSIVLDTLEDEKEPEKGYHEKVSGEIFEKIEKLEREREISETVRRKIAQKVFEELGTEIPEELAEALMPKSNFAYEDGRYDELSSEEHGSEEEEEEQARFLDWVDEMSDPENSPYFARNVKKFGFDPFLPVNDGPREGEDRRG